MSGRYTPTAIALHWLLAALILANLAFGLYMSGLDLSPQKLRFLAWHKWAGVTILLLSAARLMWRLAHAPASPAVSGRTHGARLPCLALHPILRRAAHGMALQLGRRLPDRILRRRAASRPPRGRSPGRYVASGNLTIKGISHPIMAPFTLAEARGTRTVAGEFVLKRLQFEIGEGPWADPDTVADEVLVRFRFTIPTAR